MDFPAPFFPAIAVIGYSNEMSNALRPRRTPDASRIRLSIACELSEVNQDLSFLSFWLSRYFIVLFPVYNQRRLLIISDAEFTVIMMEILLVELWLVVGRSSRHMPDVPIGVVGVICSVYNDGKSVRVCVSVWKSASIG